MEAGVTFLGVKELFGLVSDEILDKQALQRSALRLPYYWFHFQGE